MYSFSEDKLGRKLKSEMLYELNTSANILNSMIYLQYIHGLQTFQ